MPQLTIVARIKPRLLTGNRRAGLEDGCDLRVHLDHEITFTRDLLVALQHPQLHPLGKWVAFNRVDDVGDVLPRKLEYLVLHHWQCPHHLLLVLCEGQHVLDRQALVLRHRQDLDILALDELSFAISEITQVPDGYIVVARQVGSAFAVEEAVDLLLGLVLGGELC